MERNTRKFANLLVVLGFVLSALAAATLPAGAAAGRAPVFSVTAKYYQNDTEVTAYDINTGPPLVINLTITNSGDNATDANVTLSYTDDFMGFLGPQQVNKWGPMAINNDTPTLLSYSWEFPMIFVFDMNNSFIVNITVGDVDYPGFILPLKVLIGIPNVGKVDARSSNTNASLVVLGIDTVTVNTTVKSVGNKDITDGSIEFFLDDSMGSSLGTIAIDTLAAGASKDYSFTTNFTGVDVPLGMHKIAVEAMYGYNAADNTSAAIDFVAAIANVTIDSLSVSIASAFEGANVTFTAMLNNTGTAGAVGQTVEFWDGTTLLGNVTNISVGVGELKPVTFTWTLPGVTGDLNKTITAKVGTASSSVNLTIKHKFPLMLVVSFTVPDGKRIGDTTTFAATVKNNGTGDATGAMVEFWDGTTKLGNSTAFNLTPGSSKDVSVSAVIGGTGDVNHTFLVKVTVPGVADVTQSATKLIGHTLAPAKVGITTFTVKTKTYDNKPKDSSQSDTLTIVLTNSGELASSNCTLTIMEGKKVVATESIVLAGSGTVTKTYTWKVSGSGGHTAIATLSGSDAGTPATMSVKCTLNYTPGFEVLFLVAAIGIAAILVRRRKN